MKRIKCNLFGEGQYIYFNIGRLAELEKALKKPIIQVLQDGALGINEILKCYAVGMQQERRQNTAWYAQKIQELVEQGVTFETLTTPILKALIGSGILGKKAYFMAFPDEMTAKDKEELEDEETLEAKEGLGKN